MKVSLYAMRDRLTGFLAPTCDQHDHVAVRNFEHAILSGSGLYDTHPEDFSLYRIGYYDSDSGRITPCDPPEQIATGAAIHLLSFRNSKEEVVEF